jgi:hypothetical protein
MLRDWPNHKPKYDANANAGVGAVGAYLSVYEGFLRKPSFFDAEQALVSTAINAHDRTAKDIIAPEQIEMLLFLQRRQREPNYQFPARATEAGINQSRLANRIADLMNETYQNAPATQQAQLTVGKFNFLAGFGYLDHYPTSLAFVEMANKSKDMQDVKEAKARIKDGEDPHAVFKRFGIDIDTAMAKVQHAPAVDGTQKLYADRVPRRNELVSREPKGPKDFADQTSASNTLAI